MRIRYSKKDPRAGMVVDLDEGAARTKIDAGEAEEVTGKAATTEADKAADAAAADTASRQTDAERQSAAGKTTGGKK